MRSLKSKIVLQNFLKPILVLAFLLALNVNYTHANDAQRKIDSLIAVSETDISTLDKLYCYLDISYYYQPIDTTQTWVYYYKLVDLAKAENQPSLIASAQMDIGNWYYNMGNIDRAQEVYLGAIKTFNEVGNVKNSLLAWLNIAALESTRTHYEAHKKIVDSCLIVAQKNQLSVVEQSCYLLIGVDYWRDGALDKAMEYTLLALKMAEDLKLEHKLPQMHHNLGMMYNDQGKSEKALYYLRLAVKTDYFIDPAIYFHTGEIYQGLNNSDLATIYFDSAQILAEERDDFDLQSGILNSRAELAMANEGYRLALSYLRTSMMIIDSTDQKENIAFVNLNLSKVNSHLDKPDSAMYFVEQAIEKSIELGEKENLAQSYLWKSELYQITGEYSKALEFIEKYNTIKDEILNEKRLKNISIAEIKYETAKKDLEIARNKQNVKNLQDEKSDLQLKMLLGLVILVVIFGGLIATMKVSSTQKEQKLQEHFTKKIIQSQEEERKRIASDLHDSIGQNLLLIKRDKGVEANTDLNMLVAQTLTEVRSISRNLHPPQLEKLGLTKAIEEMVDKCETVGDIVFSDEVENLDGLLSKEQEIILYRIIQECFNNVIKHSQAKSARLIIRISKENINIEIQDNGIGFNAKVTLNNSKGLGLISLTERTKYLNGKMRLNSTQGEGTMFNFVIPIKS